MVINNNRPQQQLLSLLTHQQQSCSSFRVNDDDNHPEKQPLATRRSVRFGDETCREEEESSHDDKQEQRVLYDDEIDQLWYSRQDYNTFRQEANQAIECVRQMEDLFQDSHPLSYRNVMEQVWQACCHYAGEHHEVDDDDDPRKIIPLVFQEVLQIVLEDCDGPCRLGLEKHSVYWIRYDMIDGREQLVTIVQRFEQNHCCCNDEGAAFSWNEWEHALARNCRQTTRASQWFAVLLAQAQCDAETDTSTATD